MSATPSKPFCGTMVRLGAGVFAVFLAATLTITRFARGLSFLAAYTYSRSLDQGAGGNSSSGESLINIQNPQNLSADYGLSNFNYSQRFTLSTLYELPFGRERMFLKECQ